MSGQNQTNKQYKPMQNQEFDDLDQLVQQIDNPNWDKQLQDDETLFRTIDQDDKVKSRNKYQLEDLDQRDDSEYTAKDVKVDHLSSDQSGMLNEFINSFQGDQDALKDLQKLNQLLNLNQENIYLQRGIFVIVVIVGDPYLAEKLWSDWKQNLQNILPQFHGGDAARKNQVQTLIISKNFQYSKATQNTFKKDNNIIQEALNPLIQFGLVNLANYLIEKTEFYQINDDFLILCTDKGYFDFMGKLLKKHKNYHKQKTESVIHKQASRASIAHTFSQQVQESQSSKMTKRLSYKLEDNNEFLQEYHKINDLLERIIEAKQERIAVKLLRLYNARFDKSFVRHNVLDKAIQNDCFYFFKLYFDIYPKSRYKVAEYETITRIIEILDDNDNFINGLFCMTKINLQIMTEIHVRLIIQKYEDFYKKKLILLTYTHNPIAFCVQICICLRQYDVYFPNVKIRLNQIAENFLAVGQSIINQLTDEVVIKTLYLKVFYPCSINLLKLCYSDQEFYAPIISSEILLEIVANLWYCEYNWTTQFYNSSSCYKNLHLPFGHQNILQEQQKQIQLYENEESNEYDVYKREETPKKQSLLKRQSTKFSNDEKKSIKHQLQYSVDLQKPFAFFQQSNFETDIKPTNHIFGIFFWQKSPSFKVLLDMFIYWAVLVGCFYFLYTIDEGRRNMSMIVEDQIKLYTDPVNYPIWASYYNGNYSVSKSNIFNVYLNTNWTQLNGYFNSSSCFMTSNPKTIIKFPQCDTFLYYKDQFLKDALHFQFLLAYFYLSFFSSFCEVIFNWKIQKTIDINLKQFSDIFLMSFAAYSNGFYDHYFHDQRLLSDSDFWAYWEFAVTIFMILLWLKMLGFLKLTKRFGVLLKIIEYMVLDLFNFFVIYMILNLAFGTIFWNSFDESHDEYTSYERTLRQLILIMYGQVDFSGFRDNITLASVFINIYAIAVIILILNLLIAILTNTFEKINSNASLENSRILFQNYLQRKPNKYYSMLISMAPPFNFISLFVFPFQLMKPSAKRNKKFVKIGFLFYTFFYTLIFISLELVFQMITYVYYIFLLPFQIIIKSRNGFKGIIVWILWLFVGLFYQMMNFALNDLPLFFKSLYHEMVFKDKFDYITLEEIKIIRDALLEFQKNGQPLITHAQLTEAIDESITKVNRVFRRNSLLQKKQTQLYVLQSLQALQEMNEGKDMIKLNIDKNAPKVADTNQLMKQMSRIKGDELIKSAYTIDPSIKKDANLEKQITASVFIDKLEVFAFLKQFLGINGQINVHRMLYLINQLKFFKKFSMVQLNKEKRDLLVNKLQVVQILDAERSVFNVISEQVRAADLFDNIMQKYDINQQDGQSNGNNGNNGNTPNN